MTVIETNQLTKIYPSGGGCSDISLTIEAGETFGLLGPNGAGKSTFIKMLVGLLAPTAGEGWLLGLPLRSVEARRQVGFLPENFRYHDWMSAEELLEFHGALHGLGFRDVRKRIPEVLDLVRLSGTGNKLVRAFSKGMQQRLGLAVALLPRPRLLFLDEPTSALDPLGRREIREIILRLREEGVAVFLNSHLLTEVEKVCQRVAVIKKGCIVAQGGLKGLLENGLEVELHVGGLTPALREMLTRIGRITHEEEIGPGGARSIRLQATDRDRLPALAEMIVAGGGKLYHLALVRSSLEELFVELMAGEQENA